MDINELLQCLHKEYTLTLNNPNPQTGSGKITIKIKKSDITENIDEELNQTYSNIRFTLDDEKKTLLPHNLYYDYYYIKLPFFTTSTQIILHILPKSYTYPNDNSVFLFKADMSEAVIEKTPEYQVTVVDGNLKIEFLQKEITPGGEVISPRKPENMTIKQQDPDDYWIKEDEYNNEDIINLEEIPSDVEPIIYNVFEDVEMDIELGKIYNMNNFESDIITNPITITKHIGADYEDVVFKRQDDSIIGDLSENNIINKLFNEENFYINIWIPEDSYIKLNNGTIIEFDQSNTPITNFGNSQSILVNGQSISTLIIKELVLGNSYNSVTTIPAYFLEDSLRICDKINLSGFKNVVNINQGFLSDCYLTGVIDLSWMENVTNIGNYFLNYNNINGVNIGSVNWNNITTNINPFYSSSNYQPAIIYTTNSTLGNNFKTKIGTSVSNWTVVVE